MLLLFRAPEPASAEISPSEDTTRIESGYALQCFFFSYNTSLRKICRYSSPHFRQRSILCIYVPYCVIRSSKLSDGRHSHAPFAPLNLVPSHPIPSHPATSGTSPHNRDNDHSVIIPDPYGGSRRQYVGGNSNRHDDGDGDGDGDSDRDDNDGDVEAAVNSSFEEGEFRIDPRGDGSFTTTAARCFKAVIHK